MPLDHTGWQYQDFAAAKTFFEKALGPLGYKIHMQGEGYAGFGVEKPDFWVTGGKKVVPAVHVAFVANNHATVDKFYKAAIAAGGKDNGKPGLRPQYHAHYYAAFVLDPDGHNIEVVCHTPQGESAPGTGKAAKRQKRAQEGDQVEQVEDKEEAHLPIKAKAIVKKRAAPALRTPGKGLPPAKKPRTSTSSALRKVA